jgi:hypothetical protein
MTHIDREAVQDRVRALGVRAAPDLDATTLRRLRSAVEAGDETFAAIGKRFRVSRATLQALVAAHGWVSPHARTKRTAA